MFGQSLLSAFGIACTTDTDQLFTTPTSTTSLATYQLNNATTSIPNNTYPGTPSNITYTTGKFGDAAVFNGSNSQISLGSANNFASNKLTISFWHKPTATPSPSYKVLFSTYGSSFGDGFFNVVRLANNKIDAGIYAGSGYFYRISDSAIFSNNVWKHIVIVIDNTKSSIADKFTLYVDNTVVSTSMNGSSGTPSGNMLNTSNNLLIGNWAHSSGYNDPAVYDQVRIFNTALPQAAITALYNETTTTAQSASVDYQAANPNSIAYYKMADATDQLGNFNGTANNVNFNTEGKFGFAGAFNGSSSYITANTLPAIGTGDFGFSCWFYQNSGNQQGALFSTTTQWFAANGNNNPKVLMVTDDTVTKKGDTAYAQGVWNHAVFTRASGVLKIYQNGSEVFSGSYTDSWDMTQFGIGVARAVGSRVYYFNGKIDQIRLYNAALSAANVSTLYKEVECEPAAINALANFNTVLYTGDDVSHPITGVGFKPGFTWIKRRVSGSESHALYDNIRGINKQLSSDSTAAEATNTAPYEGFTSFDDDGFTVNNNGATNRAPNTYAAWNWKAPFANLSTNFNGSSSKIVLPKFPTLTGDVSVSGWVKLGNTTTSNRLRFVELNVTGSGYAGTLMTLYKPSNGEWLVRAGNGTTSDANILTHTYQLTQGVWYNICFTRNTSTNVTTFYVNNVQQDQETVSVTASIPSNATSIIGDINYSSSYQYNWLGEMSQIRIFDDVLTTNEVSDIYTEPAASNNTLNYPAGAGCIAAYPLQTDAVDLSGNYSGASSNVTFGQPGYLTQNTDGTIPSTVAANPEAGFSVGTYSGNSIAGATIGHGLSAAPELLLVKLVSGLTAKAWTVYTESLGNTKYLYLNTSAAEYVYNFWNNTSPTSSVFSLSTDTNVNNSSGNYVFYAFTSIPGYSKIGSYVGNGSSQTLYTGFAVKFVLIKSTTSSQNWMIYDSKRGGNKYLIADLADAEGTSGSNLVTFNSNGFSVSNSNSENQSGQTFIFLAIA